MIARQPAEVLVVDDDPDVREFIGFLLSSRGYAVTKAEDGAGALDQMRRRAPDVVLLDLMMPRVEGRDVLRGMTADPMLSRVPVIVISGASDLGPELDSCVVLRKPVNPDALVAEVARCLAVRPKPGASVGE